MSLRATLSRRLQEIWTGTPWYGDPSARILDGITADVAARRFLPGTHTIWEIVLHMTAWTEEVATRVRGVGSKPPDRGDWPKMPEASPEAWAATLADLQQARRQLLAEIEATHEEDFHLHVKSFKDPSTDTGASRAHTVTGLIEHDAYHLGQIALLKKASRS
jgi:uncharacterized damage-inducible protein DinB